jgi:2-dehydropantoate 2-reductase
VTVAIVVIGAGAIGLLVASRLARAGEQVALLTRPRAAAELAARGMRVRERGAARPVRGVALITAPAALAESARPPELAILCVKGYDTAGALPAIIELNPQHVLTLQNGIGHEETLAAALGPGRVLSGAITTSVDVEAPGQVVVAREGGIGVAGMLPGAQAELCADRMRRAGIVARSYADYRALKWSKALLNMLGNATAAILDMPVAAVYADPRLVALERRCVLEALAVMDRLDIRPIDLPRYPAARLAFAMRTIPPALLDPLLRRLVAGGRGSKLPSLLLDLRRGNPRSEGEYLYGAVARAAVDTGMDAPVNRTLWDVLRAIATGETPWDEYRGKPERLLAAVAAAVRARG